MKQQEINDSRYRKSTGCFAAFWHGNSRDSSPDPFEPARDAAYIVGEEVRRISLEAQWRTKSSDATDSRAQTPDSTCQITGRRSEDYGGVLHLIGP